MKDSDQTIRIAPLADHPEHLDTVARWLHGEFGPMNPGETLQTRTASLRGELNRSGIPVTLIAVSGDEPLGTAALRLDDLHGREDLGPWLGSVFVAREHRRGGVATALIRDVERRARALGVPSLYLFTPDQEAFYAKRGWSVLEKTEHQGRSVVIMMKRP